MKLLLSADLWLLDVLFEDDPLGDVVADLLMAVERNCHRVLLGATRQQFRATVDRQHAQQGTPLWHWTRRLNRLVHAGKFPFQDETPFPVQGIVLVPDGGAPPNSGEWLFLTQALERARSER